jgi:hypothetical protein
VAPLPGDVERLYALPPPTNPTRAAARGWLTDVLAAHHVRAPDATAFLARWERCATLHRLHEGTIGEQIIARVIEGALLDVAVDPVGANLRAAGVLVAPGSAAAAGLAAKARAFRRAAALLRGAGEPEKAQALALDAMDAEGRLERRRRGAPMRHRLAYLLEWALGHGCGDILGTNARWRLIAAVAQEWSGRPVTAAAVRTAVLRARRADAAAAPPCRTDPAMLPAEYYLTVTATALRAIQRDDEPTAAHDLCGRRLTGVRLALHRAVYPAGDRDAVLARWRAAWARVAAARG